MNYCIDLILGKAFCIFIFFHFPDSRLSVLKLKVSIFISAYSYSDYSFLEVQLKVHTIRQVRVHNVIFQITLASFTQLLAPTFFKSIAFRNFATSF